MVSLYLLDKLDTNHTTHHWQGVGATTPCPTERHTPMAIEETPSGALVITGEDINTYALLHLASALAMKINHGMEPSRAVTALQGAKNLGIIPADKRGNAKTALKLTVQKLRDTIPGYEPSATVAKALVK